MNVLVTGGLGFIGSNFIRHALNSANDIRIVNLDKMSYGSNPPNLKDTERDPRYKFIKGDICDKTLVEKLIAEADVVVNFAAESHVDRSIANPWPFFKSNTEGILTILEAIRASDHPVRLIHVGTDESYGDISEGSFGEKDPLKPSSPYAASKAAADLLCLAYHRTYGLEVIVTRCTNNFGPYQFPEKLVPKAIIRASLGLKVPIYGSGKNVRDWLYVLDHCEAISRVLEAGRPGEMYNISGGNELQNVHIVQTILDLMGKPRSLIEFVTDRPGHDVRYSLDSSKIRTELGWRPKHRLEQALEDTVRWYQTNEAWWKPLADERALHPTPWTLEW